MKNTICEIDVGNTKNPPQVEEEFIEILSRRGFTPMSAIEFPAKEFRSRIAGFVGENLTSGVDLPFTRRTIESLLGDKHKPFLKDKIISLQTMNELTLVWGCALIRLGFRGLTKAGALDELKGELGWILSKFGYGIHPRHILFCPVLNIWQNQKNWQIVRDNDLGEHGETPTLIRPSFPAPICEECMQDF